MSDSISDPKIVVIGGGTGTYTALMGLKHYSRNITAIVTMADDGGSSGRLRDEFGHLPPGDARRALIALSDDRHMTLRQLFEYRFEKGYGLNGHSFGNLFLTALVELQGNMEKAILEASRVLNVRGQVLPVTTSDTRLFAELEDGTIIHGEHNIDVRTVKPDLRIKRVFLSPQPQLSPAAREAIVEADILVLGPGDLYTSLAPNLLVTGMAEAIKECNGICVYVCNLMTKHGETDGFGLSDFISEVEHYLGGSDRLDYVLANSENFPAELQEKYSQEKAYPVAVDTMDIPGTMPKVILGDLVASGQLVRHDSEKLAQLIISTHESHTAATVGTLAPAKRGSMMKGEHGREGSAEPMRDRAAASRSEGMKNIYVLGSGYVGLVTGACFAELGHNVTCVDIDPRKVERLSKGIIPIYEPDLEPLVKTNIELGRLKFTASLDTMPADTDFVFMCVGTPARQDNHVDLSFLETAYKNVGKMLKGGNTVIVNKSSVPPGTSAKMAELLNGLLNGHGPARVVANPEFLREGHAVSDFMHPNRIVIGGADKADCDAVASLYAPLDAPIMFTDSSTAEMIKFASNAFLATKLTFINELAALCEVEGVSVRDVAHGIGMDPRIGLDYLRAGLGYGGSCLPKDTAILSSQFKMAGVESRLLDSVIEVNESQARRLIDRVEANLGTLRGVRAGVLGLAFKSDTDDTRHSPAIRVIKELLARGASVSYYDPKATHTAGMFDMPVEKEDSVEKAVTDADVVIIATEWKEFRELDLNWLRNRMKGTVLADGRNLFKGESVAEAGLTYIGVGRKELLSTPEPAVETVAD